MSKHLRDMSEQELKDELILLQSSSFKEDRMFANIIAKQLKRVTGGA